jgi:hypothetical protein
MSTKTTPVRRFSWFSKSLGLAALALAALGISAPALAQAEKTFAERAKEYRDKIVASMEASARAAGDEFTKLKSDAAKATGATREKLAAELEAHSTKWAAAREKLSASLDSHLRSIGDELKALEEKAGKATGSARDQTAVEMEKLRGEWAAAREQFRGSLTSNMKAAREEFAHLKDQSASAAADAKVKLAPRMEKLKAEWAKNREKLAAHLEADLKQTKEEMEKLGAATSETARVAKEKLLKKLHDDQVLKDDLAKDKALDDAK